METDREMTIKKYLEKLIRGWIPKDSVAVYPHAMPKPIWWKPLWSTAWVFTVVLGVVCFVALRIPILYQIIIGGYLAIIGFAAAVYSIIKPSFINRATYVFVGMTTLGLLLSVAYIFLLEHYMAAWLSGWFNLIVIVGIQIAGGIVVDLIGKQRNYQALPFGFDDNAQAHA